MTVSPVIVVDNMRYCHEMNKQYIAKSLKITNFNIHLRAIENRLVEILNTAPDNIKIPLQNIVRAGSKRLRPAFIISMIESYGLQIDDMVIELCVSVELLHLSSLVHDDIIDKSETRWSVPTINSQYGDGVAVLAGDYLISLSLEVAAKYDPQAFLFLNDAFKKMVIGQALELQDTHNKQRTINAYLRTIDGKTVALFSASCQIAAIVCKLSPEELVAVEEFSKYFGRAFQILDDILDFIGDKTGKQTGVDIVAGVYTLPIILALKQDTKAVVKSRLDSKSGTKHKQLISGLVGNGQIADALKAVDYNVDAAAKALSVFAGSRLVGLKSFPAAYLKWTIANQMTISVKTD